MAKAKKRLGRGLNSLLRGSKPHADEKPPPDPGTSESAESTMEIPIDSIDPNPFQPRRDIDQECLEELSRSITREGILQPLIVTDSAQKQPGRYTLIAGQRRLRAATMAGLSSVPCLIRDASERQMLEWAMIENIQRKDLNPIERARGYKDYMDRFGLSQDEVAERMGQSRPTVANHVRLLDLSDETRDLVSSGLLSFGHARVLASLTAPDQVERQVSLARKVVADGMSVRALEKIVAGHKIPDKSGSVTGTARSKPAHVLDMEQRLTDAVGTRVLIRPGRKENTGKIVIEYYGLDDFDRIAAGLGAGTVD